MEASDIKGGPSFLVVAETFMTKICPRFAFRFTARHESKSFRLLYYLTQAVKTYSVSLLLNLYNLQGE